MVAHARASPCGAVDVESAGILGLEFAGSNTNGSGHRAVRHGTTSKLLDLARRQRNSSGPNSAGGNGAWVLCVGLACLVLGYFAGVTVTIATMVTTIKANSGWMFTPPLPGSGEDQTRLNGESAGGDLRGRDGPLPAGTPSDRIRAAAVLRVESAPESSTDAPGGRFDGGGRDEPRRRGGGATSDGERGDAVYAPDERIAIEALQQAAPADRREGRAGADGAQGKHKAARKRAVEKGPGAPPAGPPPVREGDARREAAEGEGKERDPAEVKREAERLSAAADAETAERYPEVTFNPESGPIDEIVPPEAEGGMIRGKYHVVIAVDCSPYQGWQALAHYWWYAKLKEENPDSPMGGYTRLLHCSTPDSIMHLVPSFRVAEIPGDVVYDYPPALRSWAFVQWLSRYPVREQYILSADPDYLFLAPPPLLATPTVLSAVPYSYVECTADEARPFCEDPRFNPNGVAAEDVPPIGSAPIVISTQMLLEAAPRWDTLLRAIHADAEASEALGWAQDMFAFALTVARPNATTVRLDDCLMIHPPYDRDVTIDTTQVDGPVGCAVKGERYAQVPMMHYTYEQPMSRAGEVDEDAAVWRWDKRQHLEEYPPLPILLPPKSSPDSVKLLIAMLNEAGQSPELREWWRANEGARY